MRRRTSSLGQGRAFSASVRESIFDFSQFSRQFQIRIRNSAAFARFSIVFLYVVDHLSQSKFPRKNLIDAFPFHFPRVVMSDGAAAAAKNGNIASAMFL